MPLALAYRDHNPCCNPWADLGGVGLGGYNFLYTVLCTACAHEHIQHYALHSVCAGVVNLA